MEFDKLVLFDIDKTLIRSPPGHPESFCFGLKEVYDIDTSIDFIYNNSMPADQQTIRHILEVRGVPEDEIEKGFSRCMRKIGEYFSSIKSSLRIDVLVGAAEIVEELDRRRYLLGLFTGNLEPIARGKLERAGLEHYFKFGGFGSDATDKKKIAQVVMQKARDNFNFNGKSFLIGDAPYEIEAGNEQGIITIGVATGKYSQTALTSAGANYTLPDLRDMQEIISV